MKTRLPCLLGSLICLLFFSHHGYGYQNTDGNDLLLSYGDEDFVSIATGRKQLISKAPATTSVITAEEIQQLGARDISEVLESVPGVHVARKAAGYEPVYIFRGIFSEFNPQVLFLINGVPTTQLLFGNRGEAWGGMPVENISRIEIIRGPGSAVYGADAFAGTINIVTKTASEINGWQTGISAGSFDEHRAWALYGGDANGWDVAFSLQLLDTDGQDENINADAQTGLDALFAPAPSASLAPGSVNSGREGIDTRLDLAKEFWRIRLGYQGRRNFETGAGAIQALDTVGEGESDRINFDVTYLNPEIYQDWELEARFSYYDVSTKTHLVLYPPGAFGGAFPNGMIGNPDVYERHYRLDLSTFYTGFEDHVIRLGGGYHLLDQYRIEESKNFVIAGPVPTYLGSIMSVSGAAAYNREADREVTYLFVQDEWRFARDWSLTAGLRFDHYSDFGSTANPRLALVWDASIDLTTKFLYGSAFRAPSFAEQFNQVNPVAVGNDNLDPEKIDTYELAFDYSYSADLRFGLNLFYYEFQDIIYFTPVAQNTGDQTGYGLELEFDWDATDQLNLKGNYAFQDSEDEQTNSDVANAPQHQFYLQANYELSHNWSLNSQLNYVIDRKRASDDVRKKIDDYATIDLTLRRTRLPYGMSAAVSIRNLTNETVLEPSLYNALSPVSVSIPGDLPQAGRSVFAEIRKTW
jgi:iron complex outermembrane receptor protein